MPEKTNIFISYSFHSSKEWKEKLTKKIESSEYAVNYSEKKDISNQTDQKIWEYIKARIYGSSVMIVLYSRDFEYGLGGKALKIRDSAQNSLTKTNFEKQGWIYKEIRCALRHQKGNVLNGIVVVMPDEIWEEKYNSGICSKDKKNTSNLNKGTYPKILAVNYGNKIKKLWKPECGCCFNIFDDSFIPVVKQSVFEKNISHYITSIKGKRTEEKNYIIKKEED